MESRDHRPIIFNYFLTIRSACSLYQNLDKFWIAVDYLVIFPSPRSWNLTDVCKFSDNLVNFFHIAMFQQRRGVFVENVW